MNFVSKMNKTRRVLIITIQKTRMSLLGKRPKSVRLNEQANSQASGMQRVAVVLTKPKTRMNCESWNSH